MNPLDIKIKLDAESNSEALDYVVQLERQNADLLRALQDSYEAIPVSDVSRPLLRHIAAILAAANSPTAAASDLERHRRTISVAVTGKADSSEAEVMDAIDALQDADLYKEAALREILPDLKHEVPNIIARLSPENDAAVCEALAAKIKRAEAAIDGKCPPEWKNRPVATNADSPRRFDHSSHMMVSTSCGQWVRYKDFQALAGTAGKGRSKA